MAPIQDGLLRADMAMQQQPQLPRVGFMLREKAPTNYGKYNEQTNERNDKKLERTKKQRNRKNERTNERKTEKTQQRTNEKTQLERN